MHRLFNFKYHDRMMHRPHGKVLRYLILVPAIGMLGGCGASDDAPAPDAIADSTEVPVVYPQQQSGTGVEGVAFVDDQRCAQCHEPQHREWLGSHHDWAMKPASDETVKGDFSDAVFEAHGVATRFFREAEKFIVETEGPDGTLEKFEVAYTFGTEPLQQYLVEFPGGRLQSLTTAWDTEKEEWYTLYPDEKIAADDALHWTGRYQSWNIMCAECHSTNLQKNYDFQTDTFKTAWHAANVSCQACHGPGGKHVEWADTAKPGGDYEQADYRLTVDLKKSPQALVEQCARCHSRRHPVSAENDHGGTFLDHYLPETLREDLYHADGQIQDEVYVYGSFVQSKMYHAGVSCQDCHNPHSAKPWLVGNALCTACHSLDPPVDRFATLLPKDYDTPDHHHHATGTEAASCVSCHMPERTYMQVDPRRDHSLRIPRPELTVDIGTPNACNQCHEDQSADWALAHVESWYGPREETLQTRYARAMAAAWEGDPTAQDELLALAKDRELPAIYRATATEHIMPGRLSEMEALHGLMSDADPLVRVHAIRAASNAPQAETIDEYVVLLKDAVRPVRHEAARALAAYPREMLPGAAMDDFNTVLAEYVATLQAHGDMPGNRFNLGILYMGQGKGEEAVDSYRSALRMDPLLLPVRFNLASALNALGRNSEAENVLREGLRRHPEEGELQYSLGLLLAEEQDWSGAAEALGKAARSLEGRPRVWYNYALALQQAGDLDAAETAYQEGLRAMPFDSDLLYAAAIFYVQQGRLEEALTYAEPLAQQHGDNPQFQMLLETIRRQLAGR